MSENTVRIVVNSTMRWRASDILFYFAFSCLAIVLGLAATASGPGVTSDSATYISMGANIHEGRGFFSDITGPFDVEPLSPVTSWPPGYSFLIAALMSFGLDRLDAARWTSVLTFGLLACGAYWLGHILGGRTLALLSCAATIVLMPIVRMASFALSEMPFSTFTVLAVVGLVYFHLASSTRGSIKWLLFCSIWTALAILVRYVGLVWVLAGLAVIAAKPQLSWRLRTLYAGGFAVISTLLLAPWLVRNVYLVGYPTGMDRGLGYHASLAENIRFFLQALSRDLVPPLHLGIGSTLDKFPPYVWLGFVLAAGAFLTLVAQGIRSVYLFSSLPSHLISHTAHRYIVSLWLVPFTFLLFYGLSLLALSSITLFPPYDWPRYLATVYSLALVLLAHIVITAGKRLSLNRPIWVRYSVTALLSSLWLVPFGVQTIGYVTAASVGQEYTRPEWRENQGIKYLSEVLSKNDMVFSNKPDAVAVLLSRPAKYLPYAADVDRWVTFLDSRPNPTVSQDYVVVFKAGLGSVDPYFSPRASASEMDSLAARRSDLLLVADYTDVSIYRFEHGAR